MREQPDGGGIRQSERLLRVLLIAVLAAGTIWLALHRKYVRPAALQRELARFGRWAPLLFIAVYAVGAMLFFPASVLTAAGGALFGPLWGTLWSLSGATLGATLAFVAARYVAADWVRARMGERLARMVRGVEEEGWRFVAFVRLVPLFPFNLVNYAFGLTRIRLGAYVLTSFVCMAPGALAYTYLGYALSAAAVGWAAGAIRKGVLALGLLVAIGFLPRFVRRFRGRPAASAAAQER